MGKKKAAKKAVSKKKVTTRSPRQKKTATKRPASRGQRPKGKKIVICLDGTGNHFKEHNSNVVTLFRTLKRGRRQVAYYDAGVGTLAAPDFKTPVGKTVDKINGLAFGGGLPKNIAEAYAYLMDTYEPGDQVYIFGFSRGAYTARALAGLIHRCGLLERGLDNLIPYALKLFGAGDKVDFKVIGKFKSTYARKDKIDIRLLGLWDTVSAYGWVWNQRSFPFTNKNANVHAVRHALAIDERRVYFKPKLWGDGTPDTKQVWFAGVHSDVGGGYPEQESGLAKYALEWMITEARTFDLEIDDKAYQRYVLGKKGNKPAVDYIGPGQGEIHKSLKGPWWIAEFMPQRVWNTELGRHRFRIIPRPSDPRLISDGATLHQSVLDRIAAGGYEPVNLKVSKDAPFPSAKELQHRFAIEP